MSGAGDILMTCVERDSTGAFDCYVAGRYLITSPQPFFEGARALIREGYDPTRRLVMRQPDSERIDRAASLAVAARLELPHPRFRHRSPRGRR
jgi:hypothetical protein